MLQMFLTSLYFIISVKKINIYIKRRPVTSVTDKKIAWRVVNSRVCPVTDGGKIICNT